MVAIERYQEVRKSTIGGGSIRVGKDGPPSSPTIFWTSYMRAHSTTNNNQLLHGETHVTKNYTRSTTNADARSVCGS